MLAAVLTTFVLKPVELPNPPPGPGQVVIDARYLPAIVEYALTATRVPERRAADRPAVEDRREAMTEA